MTNPRPKSFWDEAASRVRPQTLRQASSADGAHERRPLRRDAPTVAQPPLPATDDPLRLRLAEELDYAQRMLASIGEQLAADTSLVVRHGTGIQCVDVISQMLGHIAAVVRCATPDEAVERIGMTELKSRLRRRKL